MHFIAMLALKLAVPVNYDFIESLPLCGHRRIRPLDCRETQIRHLVRPRRRLPDGLRDWPTHYIGMTATSLSHLPIPLDPAAPLLSQQMLASSLLRRTTSFTAYFRYCFPPWPWEAMCAHTTGGPKRAW